jgi:hypothetical protein
MWWLEGARKRDPLAASTLSRMVFSALVDADFLGTQAHLPARRPSMVAADHDPPLRAAVAALF